MDEIESRLNDDLLAAHNNRDGPALVALYTRAADLADETGDTDRACFFLVHAYVYALETGHMKAHEIRGRLKRFGREE